MEIVENSRPSPQAAIKMVSIQAYTPDEPALPADQRQLKYKKKVARIRKIIKSMVFVSLSMVLVIIRKFKPMA